MLTDEQIDRLMNPRKPYSSAKAIERAVRGQDTALIESLLKHIEETTCTHESTHRGGAIWEICDDCGAKWADDQGGKPEFKWPKAVIAARARLGKGDTAC